MCRASAIWLTAWLIRSMVSPTTCWWVEPRAASRNHGTLPLRHVVESRIVEQFAPGAVNRDHQLGHQLIERRTATTLDDVYARIFPVTFDAEGVVRTFRPRRGFATPPLEDLCKPPERVQFTRIGNVLP